MKGARRGFYEKGCLHKFKTDMGRKDPKNWQQWGGHGLAPHRTCDDCGQMFGPGERPIHEGHYREAVKQLAKHFGLAKSQQRLIIKKMQEDRNFVSAVQAYTNITISDIKQFIPQS